MPEQKKNFNTQQWNDWEGAGMRKWGLLVGQAMCCHVSSMARFQRPFACGMLPFPFGLICLSKTLLMRVGGLGAGYLTM